MTIAIREKLDLKDNIIKKQEYHFPLILDRIDQGILYASVKNSIQLLEF